MSNKLKGMIWLRGQATLANKSVFLQVLMPIFIIFLYKFIFSLNGAGQELGADRLAMICFYFVLAEGCFLRGGTGMLNLRMVFFNKLMSSFCFKPSVQTALASSC